MLLKELVNISQKKKKEMMWNFQVLICKPILCANPAISLEELNIVPSIVGNPWQWRFLFSWTGSVGWYGFPAMCPFCILSCYTMAWCCMFKFISLTHPPPPNPTPPLPPPKKKMSTLFNKPKAHTMCFGNQGKKGIRMVEENEVKQVMEICVFSKFKEEFLLNSGK